MPQDAHNFSKNETILRVNIPKWQFKDNSELNFAHSRWHLCNPTVLLGCLQLQRIGPKIIYTLPMFKIQRLRALQCKPRSQVSSELRFDIAPNICIRGNLCTPPTLLECLQLHRIGPQIIHFPTCSTCMAAWLQGIFALLDQLLCKKFKTT